jgi:dTDP-glucose 4,6-dehydratase
MTNVLITGAAGFIGSHFLETCRNNKFEDVNVTALVDKISYASNVETLKFINFWKIPFYHSDIQDTSTMIRAIVDNNVNIVVNFAAETHVDNSIRDAKPFIESNVKGTLSVLEACRATKIKLLHISTDEVYGPAGDDGFNEEDKLNPKNPYAATKAAAEHLVESYRNTFGVDSLIVRPSNNYGPRQHIEKFIPKYITNCLAGKPFPLYGDGGQIREWFYVKDNARMIRELVIKMSKNQVEDRVLNLGRMASSMSNLTMCQLLHKELNSMLYFDSTVNLVEDRLGHDRVYAINTSKVMRLLPKFEFTPFDQTLKECVEYYAGSQ